MSIKFVALLVSPLVLRGKFFQDLGRVKNITSNLRCAVIVNSGNVIKGAS